jgi:diguanylate cyclase (GGDEF)-like protein
MVKEKPRVLIVEDDPDSGITLANILAGENFLPDIVTTGKESVEKLEETSYSLFFVDLHLPDVDGIKLIQEAHQKYPDLQTIIVTGHASLESAIKAIQHQVFDYITKPFENERLRIVARNAQAKYNLLKENRDLLNRLLFQEEELHRKISLATQQLRQVNEKLQEQARTDELTGLFNYRHFQERLEEEVYKGIRYEQSLTLLMVDIDQFKKYNDTLGHPAGDEIIRGVGQLIRETMRSIDFVARYGGDEYVVILAQTDTEPGVVAAEKLRELIAKEYREFHLESFPKGLTVSIGAASLPVHAVTPAELNSRADQALYRAKNEGRNRVCLPPETSTTDIPV